MKPYAFKEQIGRIQAAFAIYNFIRRNRDKSAGARGPAGENGDAITDKIDPGNTYPIADGDSSMKNLRDGFAIAMWLSYLVTFGGSYGAVVVLDP
ncbi:hypothetical protein JG688_00003079 [Phytophthora aleatoria]|uniref:Uncharacterized protein n=1 Tax=Phytophthora aleatoria TaxID=2496075 RepID=A0A8J5MAA8_9STRA|nr:hypothetical protein JG688_00003079 [Phytophthora aleatoria]